MGAEIRLDSGVADIDIAKSIVTLKTGKKITADVVVGADGTTYHVLGFPKHSDCFWLTWFTLRSLVHGAREDTGTAVPAIRNR